MKDILLYNILSLLIMPYSFNNHLFRDKVYSSIDTVVFNINNINYEAIKYLCCNKLSFNKEYTISRHKKEKLFNKRIPYKSRITTIKKFNDKKAFIFIDSNKPNVKGNCSVTVTVHINKFIEKLFPEKSEVSKEAIFTKLIEILSNAIGFTKNGINLSDIKIHQIDFAIDIYMKYSTTNLLKTLNFNVPNYYYGYYKAKYGSINIYPSREVDDIINPPIKFNKDDKPKSKLCIYDKGKKFKFNNIKNLWRFEFRSYRKDSDKDLNPCVTLDSLEDIFDYDWDNYIRTKLIEPYFHKIITPGKLENVNKSRKFKSLNKKFTENEDIYELYNNVWANRKFKNKKKFKEYIRAYFDFHNSRILYSKIPDLNIMGIDLFKYIYQEISNHQYGFSDMIRNLNSFHKANDLMNSIKS